ncbi:MAG: hypothetical protein KA371_20415 [Acidobacteria bacterium]|nr:hypothetical protein [Acidobacteriota bacterium]
MNDIQEQCRAALIEALEPFGDSKATAEVLALVDALPFDGDQEAYVRSVAVAAQTVWEGKVAQADARAGVAEAQLAILRVANLMPESRHIH